jgi:hypothetical protein
VTAYHPTPLSVALGAACLWLKRRTDLRANPELLLEFTCAWVAAVGPKTPSRHGTASRQSVRLPGKTGEMEKWQPEDLRSEL